MTPIFFEYKGAKVSWESVGNGKPLIILHGWGSNSAIMQPLAESLKFDRTCYLIDFPGFGQSPEPPQAWSVDDYTDIIAAFIEERFPGQDKVDILAHSYGARIVLKLLSQKPISSKIDKVIITGGAGLKPKRKPAYYLKKYTAKLLKTPFYILPSGLRKKGLAQMRKTSLWKKLGSSDYQKLSGVMRETFVKSVTEYLDSLLTEIDHEVLLVWGENDTATPIDQAKRMEKGLNNGVLVTISNAGHYAFIDEPSQFLAIAKAYLSS